MITLNRKQKFTELKDTPKTYVGQSGKAVSVKSTEDGLEFTTNGVGDTMSPATNSADYVPQWNGADSKTLKNGLAVGTSANNILQLDGTAKIPAVDGSQLTNLPAGTDTKVKTSSSDTTADYLATKLLAGTNITLTETSSGSRTMTIASNQVESNLSLQTAHGIRIEMLRIMADADVGLTPVVDTTKYGGDIFTDATGQFNKINTSNTECGFSTNYYINNTGTREVAHGETLGSGGDVTSFFGEKITIGSSNIDLNTVTKHSSCTATTVRLRSTIGGSDIATATFVGDVATFSTPQTLTATNNYYIVCDAGGGAYHRMKKDSAPYPINSLGLFTWVKGVIDGNETDYATEIENFVSFNVTKTPATQKVETVALFTTGNNINQIYVKAWKEDDGTNLITYDVSVDNGSNFVTGKSLDTLYTLSSNLGNDLIIRFQIPSDIDAKLYGFSLEIGRV